MLLPPCEASGGAPNKALKVPRLLAAELNNRAGGTLQVSGSMATDARAVCRQLCRQLCYLSTVCNEE
jgi:hypothetical protein